jgi:hypothetical protein
LAIAIPGAAFAGSTYVGRVKVHCNADIGHCNVNILGTAQNVPACASGPQWYVFDMSSNVWKQQLAITMVAQAMQRNVTITGRGTCNQRPGIHEDISWITLEEN